MGIDHPTRYEEKDEALGYSKKNHEPIIQERKQKQEKEIKESNKSELVRYHGCV
jgi:hypothetical protein